MRASTSALPRTSRIAEDVIARWLEKEGFIGARRFVHRISSKMADDINYNLNSLDLTNRD